MCANDTFAVPCLITKFNVILFCNDLYFISNLCPLLKITSYWEYRIYIKVNGHERTNSSGTLLFYVTKNLFRCILNIVTV